MPSSPTATATARTTSARCSRRGRRSSSYWRNAPDFHNNVLSYASYPVARLHVSAMDPESASPAGYYRSITGKMSLTTTSRSPERAYADTAGDPATFVIPGNASPRRRRRAGLRQRRRRRSPARGRRPACRTTDRVRVDAREPSTSLLDGSAIFRVHTDGGVRGLDDRLRAPAARQRRPARLGRSRRAPGSFSPNGDGSQDTFPISVRLSESSSWTLRIEDGSGHAHASSSGVGDQPR